MVLSPQNKDHHHTQDVSRFFPTCSEGWLATGKFLGCDNKTDFMSCASAMVTADRLCRQIFRGCRWSEEIIARARRAGAFEISERK